MPNPQGNVQFKFGSFAQYNSLSNKDPDTWYIITDAHEIYIGNTLYASGQTASIALASSTGIDSIIQTGSTNAASATRSIALGSQNQASGASSLAHGVHTEASGLGSHSEGQFTRAHGLYSHAEGSGGTSPATEGAEGNYSHTEGSKTKTSGHYSHAEGSSTSAEGSYSHTEGSATIAEGSYSHTEGHVSRTVSHYSHAEGHNTIAGQVNSSLDPTDANYRVTYAYAHAEGEGTSALGRGSHAEGSATEASGNFSHAEGGSSQAKATGSHASGLGTVAYNNYMTSAGRYNKYDTSTPSNNDSNTAFVVGVGTADNSRLDGLKVNLTDGANNSASSDGMRGSVAVNKFSCNTLFVTSPSSLTVSFRITKSVGLSYGYGTGSAVLLPAGASAPLFTSFTISSSQLSGIPAIYRTDSSVGQNNVSIYVDGVLQSIQLSADGDSFAISNLTTASLVEFVN